MQLEQPQEPLEVVGLCRLWLLILPLWVRSRMLSCCLDCSLVGSRRLMVSLGLLWLIFFTNLTFVSWISQSVCANLRRWMSLLHPLGACGPLFQCPAGHLVLDRMNKAPSPAVIHVHLWCWAAWMAAGTLGSGCSMWVVSALTVQGGQAQPILRAVGVPLPCDAAAIAGWRVFSLQYLLWCYLLCDVVCDASVFLL